MQPPVPVEPLSLLLPEQKRRTSQFLGAHTAEVISTGMTIFLTSKKSKRMDSPRSDPIKVHSHLRMGVPKPGKDLRDRKKEEQAFFTTCSRLGEKPGKDPAIKRKRMTDKRESLYHCE
jgi:hypothetical protein